jgi:hypothetical protein
MLAINNTKIACGRTGVTFWRRTSEHRQILKFVISAKQIKIKFLKFGSAATLTGKLAFSNPHAT